MTIHKEGKKILITIALGLVILNTLINIFINLTLLLTIIFIIASSIFFLFIFNFFRKPYREIITDDNIIYSPADGKIVVIEETEENEYFKEKKIQVSIFMSIWDVHINWFPVNGLIKYYKYHPGTFFPAFRSKSSTDNEHNTTVIVSKKNIEILVRQIAGFVARRIVSYAKEGKNIKQGNELGFIKFGSRVDIFLPLNTDMKVKLNQKVTGKETIIAKI